MKIAAFTKNYEGRRVLDFPGIELERGKIYCVIGANGSGKSTFAKALAGIISADLPTPLLEPGISVGYMPQKNYAFRMSLQENIMLGGRDEKKAESLMKSMRLEHLADKRANKLSGGETARMALARLMMKSFDLTILDEPTAAMDIESSSFAEQLIQTYTQETGCALILVTHSLQQARRIADNVLFFYKGKLLEAGEADIVLYHPKTLEAKQFLDFYGI